MNKRKLGNSEPDVAGTCSFCIILFILDVP
jgi:hypothetical protein